MCRTGGSHIPLNPDLPEVAVQRCKARASGHYFFPAVLAGQRIDHVEQKLY
jgi:hypothetical protein